MPRLYRIRVTNGDSKGRYVGPRFDGGLITNLEALANQEVKIAGTEYSLHVQKGPATQFFEPATPGVQSELKRQGYDTELVPVDDQIDHPEQWVQLVEACACGVKRRVDVEVVTGKLVSGSEYQHCVKDKMHMVPGAILATWEERDGEWVLTLKR